jgi:hypothetical protein
MPSATRPSRAYAVLLGLLALMIALASWTSASGQGSAGVVTQRVPATCGGVAAVAAGPSTCHTTRVVTVEHAVSPHVRPGLQRQLLGHATDDAGPLTPPALVAVAGLPAHPPRPLRVDHSAQDRTRAPPLSGA